MKKSIWDLSQFLLVMLLVTGLLIQSCSKKGGVVAPVDNGPVETDAMKLIPDSMFRVYLKANVCPNAFDKTGKLIDITNSEVKNFSGTMKIDSLTCPQPYVHSLRGIEYFTKMSKLIVQNTPVDSVKLAATMALDTLRLLNNSDMQYVNVSGCTSMRYIRASAIPVTTLNLANLPALNYVNLISLSRLSTLKTDNDGNLQHLMTYGLTSMKTVNVSTNPALRRIFIESAYAFTGIDVSANRKLKYFLATYCPSLKSVDFSRNDSLFSVSFEGSGVDTVDFSHNPELFNLVMMWTPVRTLNMMANPKLKVLWADGATALKTLDLRAQNNFDFYFIPSSVYVNMTDDDRNQKFQDGLASPVQTSVFTTISPATRNGVNGATVDLFGGLRVPQYLDAGGISMTNIKINDACKDNYSIVMARRVFSGMTPVQETVYAADKTTVLCNDYDPKLFKCNN